MVDPSVRRHCCATLAPCPVFRRVQDVCTTGSLCRVSCKFRWLSLVNGMKVRIQIVRRFLLLLSCISIVVAQGQDAQSGKTLSDDRSRFIRNMVGDWNVTQRMWQAPGAEATELPPAVVHRRLIGDAILQEEMELAPGAKADPFTRMAFFEYNGVTSQYEYFSIDSRAPQMMNERSYGEDANGAGENSVNLWGNELFVAPKWGKAVNAAFRYRLNISSVQQNRQLVQLYLTPVSGVPGKEFLAFEYVYTHRR
jgi:uncharacterized protein DUF1579